MGDLDYKLAAMDAALATLEHTIDRASTSPNDLANVLALLSINVRAQREVLESMVEHIRRLTDDLARRRADE